MHSMVDEEKVVRKRWLFHGKQVKAFGLTWMAYFTCYICRKPASVAKTGLAKDFHVSVGFLGLLDTVNLVCYSCGQFVAGRCGDTKGARFVLGWGMMSIASGPGVGREWRCLGRCCSGSLPFREGATPLRTRKIRFDDVDRERPSARVVDGQDRAGQGRAGEESERCLGLV